MSKQNEPKSCWDHFSARQLKEMQKITDRYIKFLSACKTERETVSWVMADAKKHGFSEDFSKNTIIRQFRGKTVLLARKGRRPLCEGLRLLGAHADTPRLDLKQHPLYEDCEVGLAKTHYYGGIRKYQWLARPLALHGVAVKNNGKQINICIGESENDPVFAIADLLPHLASKQASQKLSDAFDAEKLNLALGHAPAAKDKKDADKADKRIKKQVLDLLHERYKIEEKDLYSAELQAVPAGSARPVGLDGSLIGGYGQDDRACVFAGLEALYRASQPEYTQILIFWDKEEIGSDGATGAQSRFFEYTLEDILDAWEPKTKFRHVMAVTKAVSADVHAPIDPDYQDLHDKLNSSLLGYGPVFCKFTGHRGKYSASEADAEYVAWFRGILDAQKIPWQMAELGKVDIGGGGTVAKHLAVYGMNIIDFGPGVLSMHSPFELTSRADIYASVLAYEAFFNN